MICANDVGRDHERTTAPATKEVSAALGRAVRDSNPMKPNPITAGDGKRESVLAGRVEIDTIRVGAEPTLRPVNFNSGFLNAALEPPRPIRIDIPAVGERAVFV